MASVDPQGNSVAYAAALSSWFCRRPSEPRFPAHRDRLRRRHPLALVASMSAAVVSGLGRDFNPPGRDQALMDMIRLDAAVNPGHSGGPLLDQGGA